MARCTLDMLAVSGAAAAAAAACGQSSQPHQAIGPTGTGCSSVSQTTDQPLGASPCHASRASASQPPHSRIPHHLNPRRPRPGPWPSARLLRLLPVILACCLLLPATGPLGAAAAASDAAPCPVSSISEFTLALSNPGCAVIELTGRGLALTRDAWNNATLAAMQHGVLISRDVTVRGQAGAGAGAAANTTTLLDCGYLKGRIRTAAGVVLVFSDLFLLNCRQPSALPVAAGALDLVSLEGQGSRLLVVNCTFHRPVCPALGALQAALAAAPWPPAAGLVPAAAAAAGTGGGAEAAAGGGGGQEVVVAGRLCLPALAYAPNCWNESLDLVDVAQNGTYLDSNGAVTVGASGVTRVVNSSLVCGTLIDPDCPAAAAAATGSGSSSGSSVSDTAGLDACVDAAAADLGLRVWDTYDLASNDTAGGGGQQPDGSGSPDQGGSDAGVLLAFILPTVVVGWGLVLVIVGLLVWSQRRKAFSPCPEAVKEAYEGVVFVGLAEGSDEHSRPPTVGDGMAAVTVGGKRKEEAGGSAELPAGEPMWGVSHRSPPSWDGQDVRGPISNSASTSNCTCASAPPTVDITMAGAATATTLTSAASATAKMSPTVTTATTGTATTTTTASVGAGGGAGASGGGSAAAEGGGSEAAAAASGATATATARVRTGGGGGSAAGAATSCAKDPHALLDSGPLSPMGIPLNLVLGVDVVVSGQQSLAGRGSFGTVLPGRYGPQPVAVRVFHRDSLGGSFEELKALKRDIEGLVRHQHPNIVALLGAGESPGGDEVFMMEEPMVASLARVCHDGSGLSMERVLSVALDISLALAYLHPGVIHRNLKPASVLLDNSGAAKLTDFGLPRLTAISAAGTADQPDATTAQYMAPECFRNRVRRHVPATKYPVTSQCDIYSFGVLLWELLSGERPWRGLNAVQIALAVGYHNRRLEMPANERFPPKIRKLLMQCWEQDPSKRPTAAEVAKRLSAMIQQMQQQQQAAAQQQQQAAQQQTPQRSRRLVAVP